MAYWWEDWTSDWWKDWTNDRWGEGKFRRAQDRWAERLISEEKFSDAVAILGPEEKRVPFVRAHLAALSEPLCAALYGDFKENITREITLKDVSVEAFDVMRRSSHHLDPQLTPERAVSALQAANLYLIDDLSDCCIQYLKELADSELQMRALTTALKASYPLPNELVVKYCKEILLKSRDAISSPHFTQAHGSLIYQLIQLDELEVDEEVFWSQLLEWSAYAVRKPELLGPFAEATGTCVKRQKGDSEKDYGLGGNELAQQSAVVQMISKHMRFAAMSKEFFFDKVRTWLPREYSDAVTSSLWLGREVPEVHMSKRAGLWTSGIAGPGDKVVIMQLGPEVETPAIQNLLTGSSWKPSQASSYLQVAGLDIDNIEKVELTFSPEGKMWTCELQWVEWVQSYFTQPPTSKKNRSQIFESDFDDWAWFDDESVLRIVPAKRLPGNAASLTQVKIFRKKNLASDVAERLSSILGSPS